MTFKMKIPNPGFFFTHDAETVIQVSDVTGGHVLAVRGRYKNINNQYNNFCGLFCDDLNRHSPDPYSAAELFLDAFFFQLRAMLKLPDDIPLEFLEFHHIGGELPSDYVSGTENETNMVNFVITEYDFKKELITLVVKEEQYNGTKLNYSPTFFNNYLTKTQEESVTVEISNQHCRFYVVTEKAPALAVSSPNPN